LYVELGLLELSHFPRFVDEFRGNVLQLGEPASHIIAILVVIFALLYNVEAVQATTRHTRGCAPVLARSWEQREKTSEKSTNNAPTKDMPTLTHILKHSPPNWSTHHSPLNASQTSRLPFSNLVPNRWPRTTRHFAVHGST
jgi:hypothetical protein